MRLRTLYFVILIILAVILFISFIFGKENNMTRKTNLKNDKNILIEEINNDLTLTIYYIPLGVLTLYPLTEKDLINGHFDYKISIRNNTLRNHMSYLEQIGSLNPKKATSSDPVNVRIYCEFTSKNGKVYSFALSGFKGNMLINGELCDGDKFFYDFIANFVPYCEMESYKKRTDYK